MALNGDCEQKTRASFSVSIMAKNAPPPLYLKCSKSMNLPVKSGGRKFRCLVDCEGEDPLEAKQLKGGVE
jgi:hypothetical protein